MTSHKFKLNYNLLKSFFLLTTFIVAIYPCQASDVTISEFDFSLNNQDTTALIDKYNGKLSELVIPDKIISDDIEYIVTSINRLAFSGNKDLTKVHIPNTILQIGSQAFSKCTKLTSIDLPNSISTIGDFAFEECSSLNSISIPNSVRTIGGWAFSECTDLQDVRIEDGLEELTFDQNVFANTNIKTLYLGRNIIGNFGTFRNKSSLEDIVIGGSVTSIGDMAFYGCSALSSITLTEGIETIGEWAFTSCSSLRKLEIPSSINYIGNGAFSNSGLSKIIIEDSTDTLEFGYQVFYGTKISTLYVGRNFSFSTSFNSKDVPFNNQKFLKNLTIGNYVTTIPELGFYANAFESLVIPESVTTIGDSAFACCEYLKSVVMTGSVTDIGNYAFSGCERLTTLTLSGNLQKLGSMTFNNCANLTSVYYNSEDPLETEYNSFSGCDKNATLYVPEGSITKFYGIWPWKFFRWIKPYSFTTGEAEIIEESEVTRYDEIISLAGEKIGQNTQTLIPGIYIVRQGDKYKKIIINKNK